MPCRRECYLSSDELGSRDTALTIEPVFRPLDRMDVRKGELKAERRKREQRHKYELAMQLRTVVAHVSLLERCPHLLP